MEYTNDKFIEKAREIALRDKPLFDSLIEFEKTKRLRTKTRLNFTIDRSLASRFKKICDRKGYSMSAKIEKLMEKLVAEEEKE